MHLELSSPHRWCDYEVFPTTYATTGNQTHLSSDTPLLRDLNAGHFTYWPHLNSEISIRLNPGVCSLASDLLYSVFSYCAIRQVKWWLCSFLYRMRNMEGSRGMVTIGFIACDEENSTGELVVSYAKRGKEREIGYRMVLTYAIKG